MRDGPGTYKNIYMNNNLNIATRLVVKIGSALLVDEHTGNIRHKWLRALANDLKIIRNSGTEILLVSSGAIAVGR